MSFLGAIIEAIGFGVGAGALIGIPIIVFCLTKHQCKREDLVSFFDENGNVNISAADIPRIRHQLAAINLTRVSEEANRMLEARAALDQHFHVAPIGSVPPPSEEQQHDPRVDVMGSVLLYRDYYRPHHAQPPPAAPHHPHGQAIDDNDDDVKFRRAAAEAFNMSALLLARGPPGVHLLSEEVSMQLGAPPGMRLTVMRNVTLDDMAASLAA